MAAGAFDVVAQPIIAKLLSCLPDMEGATAICLGPMQIQQRRKKAKWDI